jgi:hypothetical protein
MSVSIVSATHPRKSRRRRKNRRPSANNLQDYAGGSRQFRLLALQAKAWEDNVIVLIAMGWLLAIWAIVILFSIFFSQNMK